MNEILHYVQNDIHILHRLIIWGCSSVGRAVRSQRTGRRFDPDQLHNPNFEKKSIAH